MPYYVLAALIFGPYEQAVPAVSSADVRVAVVGITQARGTLYTYLCTEREFNTPLCSRQKVSVIRDAMTPRTVIFREVPAGRYAIKVVHDVNDDRIIQTNAYGAPVEPVGATNNVRPLNRAPTFEESAFSSTGDCLELKVQLRTYGSNSAN
ncbi:MAG: DUF2141 domain-containing protein [Gammaproteobacteria bacterium]|nr:DUF2141 domain-containing protein [Gammaproteobacteria bacterium]MDE0367494.1 DUF2141 domain-containing protein [Gammaproteobacteria bacterium]